MISNDNVFEENQGEDNNNNNNNNNNSQKKLSLYQKALSSNNILVEDGRMSRSKRKLNLKTLFTSSDDDNSNNNNLQRRQLQHQRRFSDRQKSIGYTKNTLDSSNVKILNGQTSLEYLNNLEESLNDLEMISRTCKQNFIPQQNSVITTAKSNTLQPMFGKKNSKSFTNLFGGMRTWFRSSTTNTVDKNGDVDDNNNVPKSTSGNFLLSKSMCTSSGKKKNRTSLNMKNEKSYCDDDTQRDRSMSKLLDYEDSASTSLSTKRRKSGDRKKENSKKRVKRFFFKIN
jgi:hypothetical protein